MPILNPFIGSALIHSLIGILYSFLWLYSLELWSTHYFILKETSKRKNRYALDPDQFFQNFSQILNNRTFIAYTLIGSVTMSSLFGFIATSSDLLISQLNQHPSTFAWQFASVGVGSLTGSFISGRLSLKFGINLVIKIVIFITAMSSFTFFILSLNGVLQQWLLFCLLLFNE